MQQSKNIEKAKLIKKYRSETETNVVSTFLALSGQGETIRLLEVLKIQDDHTAHSIEKVKTGNALIAFPLTFARNYFKNCPYLVEIIQCLEADWDDLKVGDLSLPESYGEIHELVSLDPPRCDILLLCATITEETSLKAVAKKNGIFHCNCIGQLGLYIKLDEVNNYRIIAVRSSMGPYTERGSAAFSINLAAETMATSIILFGTAFGIHRKYQKIGDVVISEFILPYDLRTIQRCQSRVFKYSYDEANLYPSKQALLTKLSHNFDTKQLKYKFFVGGIMSGAGKMQCRAYKHRVVRDISKTRQVAILAGEMEGVGLLSGSTRSAPNWIIVKGISDFGDNFRDTEIESGRLLASQNSISHILTALSR